MYILLRLILFLPTYPLSSIMKQLFPLALPLLLLAGCEQPAATEIAPAPGTAQASLQIAPSVDSYMRGYAKYEQCLWGYGACAVAATEEPEQPATDGTPQSRASVATNPRVPRVRLSLSKKQLDVQFLTPYDPAVKKITIRDGEEFFVAQPETDALGVRAIKVKSGSYPIDEKWGQNGGVHFNVQLY